MNTCNRVQIKKENCWDTSVQAHDMTGLIDKRFKLLPGLPKVRIRVDWEGKESAVSAGEAAPPALSRPASSLEYAASNCRREGLFDTLVRRLYGRAPDYTTHIEILGLEPIRRRFDLHWKDIESKVHMVVRLILEDAIRPPESFVQLNNMRYSITLVGRSEAEAKAVVDDVRQKILKIFIESEYLRESIDVGMGRPVKTKATAIRPRETETGIAATENAVPQTESLDESIKPLIYRARRLGDIRCDVGESGQIRPKLMLDENRHPIMPPDITMHFRAVFDLALGKVTAFRYFHSLQMPQGHMLYEYDVLPEGADEEMHLALDQKMLARVIADLQEIRSAADTAGGDAPRLLCPVHHKTISDRQRRKTYLKGLKEVSANLVCNHIGFEILHMPRALYGDDLQIPVRSLTELTPYVILRCPLDASIEEAYAQSGMMGVSVFVGGMVNAPPQQTSQKLATFVKSAARHKLRSLAFGLETQELCDSAETAGFSCMCGDGVLQKYPNQPRPDRRK